MWHEPVPQREQDFILSSLWALNPTIKNSKERDLTTGTCLTYYENIDDFFEKTKGGKYFFFSTKGTHRHSDVEYPDNCYLLFGKETKGLPEELLMQHPDDTLRLPMIDEARSLNLSNSVAIAAYEVLRQWGYPALQNKGELHNHKWSDLNNMT